MQRRNLIRANLIRAGLIRTGLLVLALIAGVAASAAPATISGHVVGPDGKGIPQAIVFLQDAAPPSSAAPLTAAMDQFNKTFIPGVLPIVAGTKVSFPNRDQIRHHVYSFSRAKSFELPLYKGEDANPVLFDKPGVVKIGCNIHDWMSAIILVLPNEHYAVTDEEGKFSLRGLPKGLHTVAAWHARSREKTEDTTQQAEVADSDLDLTFTLTLAVERLRPATRGSRWN